MQLNYVLVVNKCEAVNEHDLIISIYVPDWWFALYYLSKI